MKYMKYKSLSKNKILLLECIYFCSWFTMGWIRLCLKTKYLINLGDFSAKGYFDAGTMVKKNK